MKLQDLTVPPQNPNRCVWLGMILALQTVVYPLKNQGKVEGEKHDGVQVEREVEDSVVHKDQRSEQCSQALPMK